MDVYKFGVDICTNMCWKDIAGLTQKGTPSSMSTCSVCLKLCMEHNLLSSQTLEGVGMHSQKGFEIEHLKYSRSSYLRAPLFCSGQGLILVAKLIETVCVTCCYI